MYVQTLESSRYSVMSHGTVVIICLLWTRLKSFVSHGKSSFNLCLTAKYFHPFLTGLLAVFFSTFSISACLMCCHLCDMRQATACHVGFGSIMPMSGQLRAARNILRPSSFAASSAKVTVIVLAVIIIFFIIEMMRQKVWMVATGRRVHHTRMMPGKIRR